MTTQAAKSFRNNQQRGKDLEGRVVEWFASKGCWAHFIQPAPDGSQPFDVIAIQPPVIEGGPPTVIAVDCKTLKGYTFPFNRAEDNQRSSFKAMNKVGVHNTYFMIETPSGEVFLLPSQDIEFVESTGKKSVKLRNEKYACIHLE